MINAIDANTGRPILLRAASQAEAEAGTRNDSMMTPLRVKQAINAIDTIEATVVLADTSSSVEETGALGLNSKGQMVLHDGESNGDELPNILDSRARKSFSVTLLSSEMNGTGASKLICEIPLTSADCVAYNVFRLSGKLQLNFSGGGYLPTLVYLIICPEGGDVVDNGYGFEIPTGPNGSFADLNGMIFLDAVVLPGDVPGWILNTLHSGPGLYSRTLNAGVITNVVGFEPGYVVAGNASGPVNQPNTLLFYLFTYDESNVVDTILNLRGEIGFERIGFIDNV